MNVGTLASLAMFTAALMLGHQVAGKAVRDAMFLSAWPATALPTIVVATSIASVLAVPIYARLLGAFGPGRVVPAGFLLSAVGHAIEWQVAGTSRWGAVVVYLHIAALGALLLSGFWSLVSELFDPKSAKAEYARIGAAGTLGGLGGGLVTARLAAAWPADTSLLFLAVLHAACAGCVLWLGRRPATFPQAESEETAWSGLVRCAVGNENFVLGAPRTTAARTARPRRSGAGRWGPRAATEPGFGAEPRLVQFDALRQAPHLRTLALMVVASTAGAAVVDFLLKAEAARPENFGSRTELLQFFAVFYTVIQLLTFIVQMGASAAVRQFGLSQTIATLPGGLGLASGVALLYPTFYVLTFVRGVEAVLRGSMFRSGYELLFVPMDPVEKRRTKTFLDVTCDRTGDAIGAFVVWLVLFTNAAFHKAELVAVAIAFSLAGLWLTRRLDTLYVDVVERHLMKQGGPTPVLVSSEAGWSVLELPAGRPSEPVEVATTSATRPHTDVDSRLQVLSDLRSGDRTLVETTLASLSRPDLIQVAQVIQLLAWDDVAPSARRVLEGVAAAHVGTLVDTLLDPETDFAIRRRIPRVLSTVATDRALAGLARGLDDPRFEVRYQCGRAIDRILARTERLSVPVDRILSAVDRELSVSPTIWRRHYLIDHPDGPDDPVGDFETDPSPRRAERNLEHVFTLLSAVLPREPLQVAFRGIQSDAPGLRALAIEYVDSILPLETRSKLWALMDARPATHGERLPPERALDRLRQSTETSTEDR